MRAGLPCAPSYRNLLSYKDSYKAQAVEIVLRVASTAISRHRQETRAFSSSTARFGGPGVFQDFEGMDASPLARREFTKLCKNSAARL